MLCDRSAAQILECFLSAIFPWRMECSVNPVYRAGPRSQQARGNPSYQPYRYAPTAPVSTATSGCCAKSRTQSRMDTVRRYLVSFLASAGSMTAVVLRARQCRLQRLLAERMGALVGSAVSISGGRINRGVQRDSGASAHGIF